jgi:hypothetical protein
MRLQICLVSVALFCAAATACNDQPEGPPRKPVAKVVGKVFVDGKPAAGCEVQFHDLKGVDRSNPTFSTAFTDQTGSFSASTYDQGDGIPPGEYVVTFSIKELNLFTMQYGGPDKLNDRYSDPAKSTFRAKVESDKRTDLGVIQLTTK